MVHGLMVLRLGRIVHKTSAATVDTAREECHAQGLVVSNTLQSANQVSAFEILAYLSIINMSWRETNKPLNHVSIDHEARRANQFRRMDLEHCSSNQTCR